MHVILILLVALIITGACAYFRSRLWLWTALTALAILLVGYGLHAPRAGWIVLGIFVVLFALPLNFIPLRRELISKPFLKIFRRVL
ncbi:MAG: hypothetical protein C4338_05735, partial [Rhodanobacteraceae bacterium]